MRVLLSNDDGYLAAGLKALREELAGLPLIDELYVVAPDRERSAVGHGITMHRPLRARPLDFGAEKTRGWAVDGTPADCVKLAIEELLPDVPDLVVSGINQGANLGTDVIYSGTVSAAVEGVINGVPAIAISLTDFHSRDFSQAARFAARLVGQLADLGLPPGVLLNVNVPPGKPAGVQVVRLGWRRYVNIFDRRTDPRGREYFWMAGEPLEVDENTPDTDVCANRLGYITITPVKIDMTDYQFMEKIVRRQW